MRDTMGSDWLRITQGITSRAGIPGKFSKTNPHMFRSETAFPKLWARVPWVPQQTHRNTARYFYQDYPSDTWPLKHHVNGLLEVVPCSSIRANHIPCDDVISLWPWVFGGCCDKKQGQCQNQHGTGNESGRVQSDSEVSEAVQSPVGIYISIVSNCVYLTLK